MENQQTTQVIKQIIQFWESNNQQITQLFTKYPDHVYAGKVAPGRNSGLYLLAHLVAVSDGLFTLLGLGDRKFPELQQFVGESETAINYQVDINELRAKWDNINALLTAEFATKDINWWLDRHMNVSAEDFAKEPHRNKLNVLLSRASHENYHRGQLVFLAEEVISQ
jgi:uncharacterized damage-inducible protein DinB